MEVVYRREKVVEGIVGSTLMFFLDSTVRLADIFEGRVDVLRGGDDGLESVIVGRYKFGDLWAVAEAGADECEILHVRVLDLEEFC